MKRIVIASVVVVSIFGVLIANAKPAVLQGMKEDNRIRLVRYLENQIVEIPTSIGFSTTVEFGSDEVVKAVVFGDTQGWRVVPNGNRLFINPSNNTASKFTETNVTVVTDKRTYYLYLVMSTRKDPVFAVKYQYSESKSERKIAQIPTKDCQLGWFKCQKKTTAVRTTVY